MRTCAIFISHQLLTGLERHPTLLLEKPKPETEEVHQKDTQGSLAAKKRAITKRKKMLSGE